MTNKTKQMRKIIEKRSQSAQYPGTQVPEYSPEVSSTEVPEHPSTQVLKNSKPITPIKHKSIKNHTNTLISDYKDVTSDNDPLIKRAYFIRTSQDKKLKMLLHMYFMRKGKMLESSQLLRYILDSQLDKLYKEFSTVEVENPFEQRT